MTPSLPANIPNFYIIGAAKCGTSSLFANIIQHPDIYKSDYKELNYFDSNENYSRGSAWYLNSYFQGAERYKASGEATPAYIYWAEIVAPRMVDMHQGSSPKFIAIFRNPVERAYSQYWQELKSGQPLLFENRKPISFERALDLEELLVKTNTIPKTGTGYSYFRGGLYAAKIRIFQQYFPRENFLFLLYDDFKHDPNHTFADIFRFIGVDDQFKTNSTVRNTAAMPKNRTLYNLIKKKSILKELIKPIFSKDFRFGVKQKLLKALLKPVTNSPMKPETEMLLREKFQESIYELEDLLGWDLTAWHSGPGK